MTETSPSLGGSGEQQRQLRGRAFGGCVPKIVHERGWVRGPRQGGQVSSFPLVARVK